MKITGNNPVRPATATQRKKESSGVSSAGSAFLNILGEAEATPAPSSDQPISDIQPISTLGALLSLQEMPEEEIRNRKAVQQGKSALESLEQLRHGLLMGNVSTHTLSQLQEVVSQYKQGAADPRLNEIMNDIELRAAVELAKLEKAKVS